MFLDLLLSLLSLVLVVFAVPLAFDVGGRSCGLAFSLALTTYFFVLGAFRASTPSSSRLRSFVLGICKITQCIVIPALMIWALSKYGVDSDAEGVGRWTEYSWDTVPMPPSITDGVGEWFFGRAGVFEQISVGIWDKVLRWSTPVFQLGEGFCSILVIQAFGQVTRWLVNGERGDSWMVSCSLLLLFTFVVVFLCCCSLLLLFASVVSPG